MSRAQERSSGPESGAQPTQRTAGNMPGTTENTTGGSGDLPGQAGTTAGATSTGTTQAHATGVQPASAQAAAAQATDAQVRQSDREWYGTSDETATGTGGGYAGLGGVLSVLAGLLAFLAGLAVVVRTSFYPSLPGYAYRINTHAWGWVLLVLGVLLFAAGAMSLLGMAFGRIAAIALAVLLAIGAFLTLPYLPLWSIVLIALSVVAIWGLVRDGEHDDGGGGNAYGDSYRQGSVSSEPMTSGPRHRM